MVSRMAAITTTRDLTSEFNLMIKNHELISITLMCLPVRLLFHEDLLLIPFKGTNALRQQYFFDLHPSGFMSILWRYDR